MGSENATEATRETASAKMRPRRFIGFSHLTSSIGQEDHKLGRRSHRREFHKRKGCSAIRPIRITQRFENLQVVEVPGLDDFDRLSSGLYCCSKISVLALKLRGLMGAVGHEDRCAQQIEVALRAHRLF